MNDQTAPALIPTILTAIEIAALRQANRVCFRHVEGGVCQVEAIKEAGKATIKNPIPTEARLDISAGVYLTHYGARPNNGDLNKTRSFRGWASLSTFNNINWRTFAHFLKPGDSLILHWRADNNNQTVTDAALHFDTLSVEIKRPRKTGGESDFFGFHLVDSICPNNSARMVRVID